MTRFSSPDTLLRRLAALAVAAAALAVPTTATAALEAPTVEVDVGEAAITIAGTERLDRGPIRLQLSGDTLSGARTVAVLELKPGVTPAEVDRFTHQHATGGATLERAHAAVSPARASAHLLDDIGRYGRLVAGGQVSAGNDHATTIAARAREHVVIDVTTEHHSSASFRVGNLHNGARLPKSTVTIGLRDKGINLPPELPADGVIRIANQGALPHQATAYRLKRTSSYAEAVQAAIRGRFLERFGAPTVLTGLVSGAAVNRVEVDLRPGRYLFISDYTPFSLGARSDVRRGLVATARVR